MRPSSTLSAGAFFIGVWMAFLAIINILFGAYSDGRRVNWVDFFTNGANTNSAHDVALVFPDDIVFILLSSLLIAAGACLLYTSPSPRDRQKSRMPSSA